MAQSALNESALEDFVNRWAASGGAERANYQLFLAELCDVLDVPRPEPTQPDHHANAYVFDRALEVTYLDGTKSSNFIDLYKRGCFVLETKQGVEQREEAALSSVRRTALKKLKKGHGVRGSAVWDTAMIAAKGRGVKFCPHL